MKIKIEGELAKDAELAVKPKGRIKLPAQGIFLVDSSILFPAIFPIKKRNPPASDDYNSFNPASMNILGRIYFERWGIQKTLKRHDSESLLMILRS